MFSDMLPRSATVWVIPGFESDYDIVLECITYKWSGRILYGSLPSKSLSMRTASAVFAVIIDIGERKSAYPFLFGYKTVIDNSPVEASDRFGM